MSLGDLMGGVVFVLGLFWLGTLAGCDNPVEPDPVIYEWVDCIDKAGHLAPC